MDTLKGAVDLSRDHRHRAARRRARSEFTFKIDPKNLGVMLRRKLDYQYPNQRAEISISDPARPGSEWQPAGVWYLAGSNSWIHSNPGSELGPAEHAVRTSNRRFRDDEFLIPKALTAGRSSIRVRVKFTAVDRPSLSDLAGIQPAWSEIRYDAYSYREPAFSLAPSH